MKPKIILVVATHILTLSWVPIIAFPLVYMSETDWKIARLVIAGSVVFLIWLAAKMIQRKKYAWYLGILIYGIPALMSELIMAVMIFSSIFAYRIDWFSVVICVGLGSLVIVSYFTIFLYGDLRCLFETQKMAEERCPFAENKNQEET